MKQTEALELVIRDAWTRPFYRRHWQGRSLEDAVALVRAGRFHELPLMRKTDIQEHWDDLISVDDIVDIMSSSGTTGRPADIPLCRADESKRIELARRWLDDLGVRPGSRVLLLFSLNDMFSFGLIAWLAIRAHGACAIRCSVQRVERVLQVFQYLQPEFVIGNPFPMVRLAEEAGPRWPQPAALPRRAFFSAASTLAANLEPPPVIKRLQELWQFDAWASTYGSSEAGAIADECLAHQGMHVIDDFSFVEVIDPATGLAVEPERPGEVVITGLTLPRSFVPIRYATGDIVPWVRTGSCACGRSNTRLGPVIGRSNFHLKVTGQTVYPDLLLSLADETPGVSRSAVRVQHDPFGGDDVAVLVVAAGGHESGKLRDEVAARLAGHLAVSPRIELIGDQELRQLEEDAARNTNQVKIPRFFDLRRTSAR